MIDYLAERVGLRDSTQRTNAPAAPQQPNAARSRRASRPRGASIFIPSRHATALSADLLPSAPLLAPSLSVAPPSVAFDESANLTSANSSSSNAAAAVGISPNRRRVTLVGIATPGRRASFLPMRTSFQGRSRATTSVGLPPTLNAMREEESYDEESLDVRQAREELREQHAASVEIQKIARGRIARRGIAQMLVENYGSEAISMEKAEKKARDQVCKQESGELWPLNMPIDNFSVFGEAVLAYMHYVYRGAYLFLFCFLLSISNTITFIEGSDMGAAQTLLSRISLGNTDILKPSCAVMEFVISGVLVYFLFWSRSQQLQEARVAREVTCTPADFSVMISGLPERCTDAENLANYLRGLDKQLSDLIAVTISFNYRDLIHCVQERDEMKKRYNSGFARKVLLGKQLRESKAKLHALSEQAHEGSRSVANASPPLISSFLTPLKPRSSFMSSSWSFSGSGGGAATNPPTRNRSVMGAKLAVARSRAELDRTIARHERAIGSIDSQIISARQQLQRQDEKILRMVRSGKYHCTGFAFVTFNEESAATRCLQLLNSDETAHRMLPTGELVPAAPELGNARLRGERPPEPEEVYWDQLQFKHPELVRRQVIAISLMMCVALAGTVIISFANYGMGPVMASANSLASRVGLQVVFTLLIILGNIFIFILTPIVAHRYERHYTFGGKELSCFSKMVSFQVFNTVVASTVFYFFSSFFEPTRHSWYEYGSSMVLNVLIGDIFVINLGIDFGQPGQLITKYLQAPTARTQRELNTMVTSSRTADIYLAFRLQLVVKIVVICLIYSSAIPICYLLTAFFMLLAMWIDRYNLLRRLAPPPRSPDALVSLVLGKIFPAAIAIHLACTVMYYTFQRGIMYSDPLCSAETETLVTGFTGGLPVLADGTRCQTTWTLLQADTSVAICWAALLIYGAFLMYFMRREARRPDSDQVHMLDDDFVAKFADVFVIQEPPRQVLAESRSNPFRRDEELSLYTPPLPRWVVAQLGTDLAKKRDKPMAPRGGWQSSQRSAVTML